MLALDRLASSVGFVISFHRLRRNTLRNSGFVRWRIRLRRAPSVLPARLM